MVVLSLVYHELSLRLSWISANITMCRTGSRDLVSLRSYYKRQQFMPESFSYAALEIWPVVCVFFFPVFFLMIKYNFNNIEWISY